MKVDGLAMEGNDSVSPTALRHNAEESLLPNHASTCGAGFGRMSSDMTLVSIRIITAVP